MTSPDPQSLVTMRRDISLQMTVITRQARTNFDKEMVSQGLTRSKWTTVAAVARQPGTSQRELAAILHMSEASAGRSIDRLCQDGLLERRQSPHDRRVQLVYLAEGADPLLEQIAQQARQMEDKMFAGVSDEQLAIFKTVCDQMCENLGLRVGMERD
jgi:MarR family transcriptional regulator for hemolysin